MAAAQAARQEDSMRRKKIEIPVLQKAYDGR